MSESDLVKAEQLALFLAYNEKIDNLYSFRDSYYLNNAIKSSEDRSNDLSSKLTELLNEIDADKDKLDSKSSYLILSGKAYNVMPDFNQTACDSLKKATKLDPKSVEAWNLLGECYWKKRDFEMCRICFEQSLNVSRNKQGLRGMSMVVRQLIDKPLVPTDDKQQTSRYDHIKNSLEESIKFAKESLQLDVKDGMSWYILANCYVSKFFSPFGMQSASLLKQAVTAYNLALKDTKVIFESKKTCKKKIFLNKFFLFF